MNGPLEWIAAVGTMLAALLIALDKGRRVTGFGFVLFVAVSITWVVAGLLEKTYPIMAMNGILLLINLWGVWEYLLNPKKKKVIEKVERYQEKAEKEVEQEEAAS